MKSKFYSSKILNIKGFTFPQRKLRPSRLLPLGMRIGITFFYKPVAIGFLSTALEIELLRRYHNPEFG